MSILATARNLDFIQSAPGSHWNFLKQGKANSDLLSMTALVSARVEESGPYGVKSESRTGSWEAVAGGSREGMMVVRAACLVSRTLFLHSDHLLLGSSVTLLPFQDLWSWAGQRKPFSSSLQPCLLLVGPGGTSMGLALD